MPIFTMRESKPAHRETVFSRTGMEAVSEMVVNSSNSEPKVTAVA